MLYYNNAVNLATFLLRLDDWFALINEDINLQTHIG